MAVLSLTERAIFALGSISYRTEEFKKFHRHSVISRQAVLSPQRAESSSSLTSNVVLHPYLHLIYWVSTVLFYFEIFLPFFFFIPSKAPVVEMCKQFVQVLLYFLFSFVCFCFMTRFSAHLCLQL